MKNSNTFRARASRIAVAGAVIAGLGAAGIALAAPASAAQDRVTGPLVEYWPSGMYIVQYPLTNSYIQYTNEAAGFAAMATAPKFETPAPGFTGPIISANGTCATVTSGIDQALVSFESCNSSTNQDWIATAPAGEPARTVYVNKQYSTVTGTSIPLYLSVGATSGSGLYVVEGSSGIVPFLAAIPRVLTAPAAGATITPQTVFSGTANIGDKVTITNKQGDVLGMATVGADGTWSKTLSPAPLNGALDLVITAHGSDGKSEIIAENSYKMTASANKFEVLTPNLSGSNSITDDTVFTGTGKPGSTVTIKDKDGKTVGEAKVDDDGRWSAPVTGLPQGPNSLTVEGQNPDGSGVTIDLGSIMVVEDEESTPLMDPAIAGGAAVALIAAAGVFLTVRRRAAARA